MILILGSGTIAHQLALGFAKCNKKFLLTSRLKKGNVEARDIVQFDASKNTLSTIVEDLNVSVIINCAYDFSSSIANEQITKALIGCVAAHRDLICLNISTISAFEDAVSRYGREKFKIEQEFLAHGIASVRIGLPIASPPVGLIATICKLSNLIPFFSLAMSTPGSYTYVTPMNSFAKFLVSKMKSLNGVCTYVSPEAIDLVRLTQQISGKYVLRVHWRCVYTLMMLLELIGIRLRFGTDSIIGLVFGPKSLQSNMYE